MARDPYEMLGVPRDAGDEEIRRAYRRLAKREHPDADGGDSHDRVRHYRLVANLTPGEAWRGVSMDLELPDGRHRIEVPAGVQHGDVLSFTEGTPAGKRISVDLEVVVRSAAR